MFKVIFCSYVVLGFLLSNPSWVDASSTSHGITMKVVPKVKYVADQSDVALSRSKSSKLTYSFDNEIVFIDKDALQTSVSEMIRGMHFGDKRVLVSEVPQTAEEAENQDSGRVAIHKSGKPLYDLTLVDSSGSSVLGQVTIVQDAQSSTKTKRNIKLGLALELTMVDM